MELLTATPRVTGTTARHVLHSGGDSTIEIDLHLSDGTMGSGASPLGVTTGQYDARLAPMDVALARAADLTNCLIGLDVTDQITVDTALIGEFGPEAGEHSAANIACAASMAACEAAAKVRSISPWQHVADLYGTTPRIPRLVVNLISGGGHNDTGSPITEAVIVTGDTQAATAIHQATKLYQSLRAECLMRFGPQAIAAGLEGGLVPQLADPTDVFELLALAIAGIEDGQDITFGADMAGNGLFDNDSVSYRCPVHLSSQELARQYQAWFERWPQLGYIEDPFADHDEMGWAELSSLCPRGSRPSIIADDLLATRVDRLHALASSQWYDGVTAKINQVGTLTELAAFVEAAHERDLVTVVSQRSQETDHSILADLAVGLGSDFMKAGCCTRERIVKYNRLIRIEEQILSIPGSHL